MLTGSLKQCGSKLQGVKYCRFTKESMQELSSDTILPIDPPGAVGIRTPPIPLQSHWQLCIHGYVLYHSHAPACSEVTLDSSLLHTSPHTYILLHPFSLQLETYTDFKKSVPPAAASCSCPTIYYKLITPGWLRSHNYLTSYVESKDNKRVVFNIERDDFPRLVDIPVLPPEKMAKDQDIVINIKLSLKAPKSDSDLYLGLCSGDTCYGAVIVDNRQDWPNCPFLTWAGKSKTLSGKVTADCSGSSKGSRSNYPEEVHIRFYPKYAWISYYMAQNGGTSVIGEFQSTPDLSQGLTIELYGDNENNEKYHFQYLEIDIKNNYY